MELGRFIFVIRKWFLLISVGAILVTGLTYWISRIQTPVYSATATLLLDVTSTDPNTEYAALLSADRFNETYAVLATSYPVLSQVATSLGLDIPLPKLASSIKVVTKVKTQLLDVTVEDTIPARASAIANKVAEVFMKQSSDLRQARFETARQELKRELTSVEQDIGTARAQIDSIVDPNDPTNARLPLFARTEMGRLQSQLTGLEAQRTILLRSVEDFRLASAKYANTIAISSLAQVPSTPVRPRVLLNTSLAVLLGLLLSVGTAFLLETLDDTVKSPEEISQVVGAPVLGTLARFGKDNSTGRLITRSDPQSPISEAFRSLRTNLQFSAVDKRVKTVLVTSANPQEGKSSVTANLAVVIAQAGLSVIVVDSDLRRPSIHHLFSLDNSYGLTNALMEEEPGLDKVLLSTEFENLKVITTGTLPPNPSELLGSERMRRLIERLGPRSDLILFDSPPMGAATDAALLASRVDGVLLVIEASKTRRPAIIRAKEDLDRVGAKVLGVALNKIPSGPRSGYYYYAYYRNYHYYSEDGKRQKSARRNPFSRLFKGNNSHDSAEAALDAKSEKVG